MRSSATKLQASDPSILVPSPPRFVVLLLMLGFALAIYAHKHALPTIDLREAMADATLQVVPAQSACARFSDSGLRGGPIFKNAALAAMPFAKTCALPPA